MWKAIMMWALSVGPAVAQDWNMRAGDEVFDAQDLGARLAGRTLVFYDDGQAVYEVDGKYSYTYGGGGTWYGYWEAGEGSLVCVTFVTEVKRCDRIVQNDGQLVMLTVKGERFPIRP